MSGRLFGAEFAVGLTQVKAWPQQGAPGTLEPAVDVGCVCVCEYIKSAVVFVRHMQPLLLYWMPPETAAAAEMQLANIWNPVFKLHCADRSVFVFWVKPAQNQ